MHRKSAEVEHLERTNELLRKQYERMRADPGDMPMTGCGDGSCIVARPTGMHTNGGCRCEGFELRRAVMYWRRRSEFLQETIRIMKEEQPDVAAPSSG